MSLDAQIALINERMTKFIPHNHALGMHVTRIELPGEVWMRLPYHEQLVGDPTTGVLHGGAVTALMDAAGGTSVMVRMGKPSPIATLDLRIDYLKPAPPRRDIECHVDCYKLTQAIAFVRGFAHPVDDPEDRVASLAATFIRTGTASP